MLQPAEVLVPTKDFEPPGKSLASDVLEIAVEREPGRNIKVRKRAADFLQLQIAALGDVEGPRSTSGESLKTRAISA